MCSFESKICVFITTPSYLPGYETEIVPLISEFGWMSVEFSLNYMSFTKIFLSNWNNNFVKWAQRASIP